LLIISVLFAFLHELKNRKHGKRGPLTKTYEAYRYGFLGFSKFFIIGMFCVLGIIFLGYFVVSILQPK